MNTKVVVSSSLSKVLVIILVCGSVLGQLDDDLENEIPLTSSGSCRNSGMCCPGRDSSCVVQKAKPNAIIEDLNDIPCYCDHACLNIGDCCSDFKSVCGGKSLSYEYLTSNTISKVLN